MKPVIYKQGDLFCVDMGNDVDFVHTFQTLDDARDFVNAKFRRDVNLGNISVQNAFVEFSELDKEGGN